MRSSRLRRPRPRITTTPLASLATLVFGCVVIAGLASAARGPGLRFESLDDGSAFRNEPAIRVEVRSGGEVLVDGSQVVEAGLGEAVAKRLLGLPGAAVVLAVAPDVRYKTMLAAYGAISGLPHPPRIALAAVRDPRRGSRGRQDEGTMNGR